MARGSAGPIQHHTSASRAGREVAAVCWTLGVITVCGCDWGLIPQNDCPFHPKTLTTDGWFSLVAVTAEYDKANP